QGSRDRRDGPAGQDDDRHRPLAALLLPFLPTTRYFPPILISSISNTSMPYGARSPLYASFSGIQKRAFSPSTINCTPSVQPAMTPSSGNVAGWFFTTELSNILPSVVQPV